MIFNRQVFFPWNTRIDSFVFYRDFKNNSDNQRAYSMIVYYKEKSWEWYCCFSCGIVHGLQCLLCTFLFLYSFSNALSFSYDRWGYMCAFGLPSFSYGRTFLVIDRAGATGCGPVSFRAGQSHSYTQVSKSWTCWTRDAP